MNTVRFFPTDIRSVALLLIMALAVFLSAELSRQLSADISHMSAVWPPVGIAVGWALVMGRAVYPLYGVTLCCWFLYAGYAPVFSLVLAAVADARVDPAPSRAFPLSALPPGLRPRNRNNRNSKPVTTAQAGPMHRTTTQSGATQSTAPTRAAIV